ncbi:hypothetical protein GCM10027073_26720 [Streptomyces chlorus]
MVLRQRLVAREGACDAGVRAGKPSGLLGQPAHEGSLRAGRPDSFNVWHAVTVRKALGAMNRSQMKSLRNK